ncbi:MAG: DNA translocase FtsK [Rickettsiales bacterium]|nr:MAG: DNA translocase FtsK [Rickettsiales bacterium]
MKYKDKFLTTYQKFHLKFCATIWFLLAITLIIILKTYNTTDISFNSISTNKQTYNYAGKIGSYTADILLQFFGEVNYFFIFLFAIFGYNAWENNFKYYTKKQKFFAFIGLFLSTNLLLESGAFGIFLSVNLAYIPQFLLDLISAFIFFISFTILADIKDKKWLVIIEKTKRFIFNTYIKAKFLLLHKRTQYIAPPIQQSEKKQESFTLQPSIKESTEKVTTEKPQPARPDALIIEKPKEIKQVILSSPATKKNYKLPVSELLSTPNNQKQEVSQQEYTFQMRKLREVLSNYKIEGKVSQNIKVGPIVTLYEFEPKAGTQGQRVIRLSSDIAREMELSSIRIATAEEKNAFYFEVPNKVRQTIFIKTLIDSEEYRNSKAILPMILGTDIAGKGVVVDLTKMPHLLVAGTTGSGKSVGINTIIASLLYKFHPDECKFIMIDPKQLELSVYEGIPHLLTPVITAPQEANNALKWACKEMDDRYGVMAQVGVRNIEGYNEKLEEAKKQGKPIIRKIQIGFDNEINKPIYKEEEITNQEMPYIVIIIDEMADLMAMAKKDIELSVQRIAQKARAAGIHLIMATQRPSVDVVTGVIKANFPSRISFQVVSSIDSKTILGEMGAEQLLGKGDMLYMANGGKKIRIHGPFVSDSEVEKIVNFIKEQGIEPKYVNEVLKTSEIQNDDEEVVIEGSGDFALESSDEALERKAIEIIKTKKRSSASYFQTALGIGYPKAAKLVEKLAEKGILSEPDRNGKREILINTD